MKKLFIPLFCILFISSQAQEPTAAFDGHSWEAPYHLPVPEGWGIERFLIPIGFAPAITYKGVEDIRFTPGWAKPTSDEYWTYAFLWYLDGKININEKIIEQNLKSYYTGLYAINTPDSTKAAVGKLQPVVTAFQTIATTSGDLATYSGTIHMVDYLQQKPITLNCIVHYRLCTETNKTIVFYELSPQPFTHSNWKSLNQIWLNFTCKK